MSSKYSNHITRTDISIFIFTLDSVRALVPNFYCPLVKITLSTIVSTQQTASDRLRYDTTRAADLFLIIVTASETTSTRLRYRNDGTDLRCS